MHRILSRLIHSAIAIVTKFLRYYLTLLECKFQEKKKCKGLTGADENNLFFFTREVISQIYVIAIELGARICASTYYNSQRTSRSLEEVQTTQRKRVFDVSECLSRDERDEYWYPYKSLWLQR